MIRTIITPQNQDLSIHIPEDYVGKQVEVLLYTIDEIREEKKAIKKHSEFRGKLNLTEEQYADFQTYLKDTRDEWNRDI